MRGRPEFPALLFRPSDHASKLSSDAQQADARERLAGELAEFTGRPDVQKQLLADYRTQLGMARPLAECVRFY